MEDFSPFMFSRKKVLRFLNKKRNKRLPWASRMFGSFLGAFRRRLKLAKTVEENLKKELRKDLKLLKKALISADDVRCPIRKVFGMLHRLDKKIRRTLSGSLLEKWITKLALAKTDRMSVDIDGKDNKRLGKKLSAAKAQKASAKNANPSHSSSASVDVNSSAFVDDNPFASVGAQEAQDSQSDDNDNNNSQLYGASTQSLWSSVSSYDDETDSTDISTSYDPDDTNSFLLFLSDHPSPSTVLGKEFDHSLERTPFDSHRYS
eukprot:TRINITY_DN1893_c0_g1_i1.p1 TRINITY_DN1893_c0_g1~~TRINITY_DN1893_c0_g1_i1.p1  ORF type:complete len:262 (+),score=50.87 TRINITY_DN1893_c0_g1_i1:190-975(+)